MSEYCEWNIYDREARVVLGFGLYLAGIISLILSSMFLASFARNSLMSERSHLMLFNLCLASFARSLLAGFLFSGLSAVSGRWLFGDRSCTLFGFLNQFLGVYQMEALTHMCIERYVVAKYIKNGWEMTNSRYLIFIILCLFFSTAYSVPELVNVGGYSLDFSCTYCTFSLQLPNDATIKYTVIGILLLQSVKPVFVIYYMLIWTKAIERERFNEKEHSYNMQLTKTAISITASTLLCWFPSFVVSSWVVSAQLLFGEICQPPVILAIIAAIGSELVPAVIVVAIIWSNERLRLSTIGMFSLKQAHNKAS